MTAVEPRCVCGDTLDAHEPVQLSVPLVGKNLYPVKVPLMPIVMERAQIVGTYESVQCHCGCTAFTPDDDRTDWVHLARQ